MMELFKHIVRISNSYYKISDISRIIHDPCDNTIKVLLTGRPDGDSGWNSLSAKEFQELLGVWDSYLERTSNKSTPPTKEANHV